MVFLHELESIRDEMVSRKKDVEKELSAMPDGVLYQITAKSGKRYYYERLPKSGRRRKERRRAVNKDESRLADLVRKEYLHKALDKLDRNIDLMNRMIAKYRPSDENSIMKDFINERPELGSYIYSQKLTDEEWARSYKPSNDMYEDDFKSVSAEGVLMRSVAEISISSMLQRYGIPYRYEAPLNIPDLPYVPDFTIKRPRDGEIIYWEHLGLVSDDKYMEHNRRKIESYGDYGIVPWRNLIITYGNEKGGIDLKIVDAMIKAWLL